jgi:hypothetical protein
MFCICTYSCIRLQGQRLDSWTHPPANFGFFAAFGVRHSGRRNDDDDDDDDDDVGYILILSLIVVVRK